MGYQQSFVYALTFAGSHLPNAVARSQSSACTLWSAVVDVIRALARACVAVQATNSWPLVFGITAGHYLLGAVLWALWVGDKPLPEDADDAMVARATV